MEIDRVPLTQKKKTQKQEKLTEVDLNMEKALVVPARLEREDTTSQDKFKNAAYILAIPLPDETSITFSGRGTSLTHQFSEIFTTNGDKYECAITYFDTDLHEKILKDYTYMLELQGIEIKGTGISSLWSERLVIKIDEDLPTIIKKINKRLEDIGKEVFIDKKYVIMPVLNYDSKAQRISLINSILDGTTLLFLNINGELGSRLGFDKTMNPISFMKAVRAPGAPPLSSTPYIYVHCDIIENSWLNHRRIPLLSIMKKSGVIVHPHYIPLAKRTFNRIKLTLGDEHNQLNSSEDTFTIITLHLRKKQWQAMSV